MAEAAAVVLFIGDSKTVLTLGADAGGGVDFSSPLKEATEDELELETPAEWYLGLGCLVPYTDLAFLMDSEVREELELLLDPGTVILSFNRVT